MSARGRSILGTFHAYPIVIIFMHLFGSNAIVIVSKANEKIAFTTNDPSQLAKMILVICFENKKFLQTL